MAGEKCPGDGDEPRGAIWDWPMGYVPGIGRFMLHSEELDPAVAYLQERVEVFIRELPFVSLVAGGTLKRLGRGDGQDILTTLSEHPNYRSSSFNNYIDCEVIRTRIGGKSYGDVRCVHFSLQIQEIGYPSLLPRERVTLLNHMGVDSIPKAELSKGIRLPLASVTGFEESSTTLGFGFKALLPEAITLGPLQMEPHPLAE